jgi:selenide, water dikinase
MSEEPYRGLTRYSHGAGGACKLGPGDLAQVLRRFGEQARSEDPNLLLGLDMPDDAAVYRIADGVALIQTVDFFTPVVDDPYDWGAIAAANALSDVYAMGGRPLLALNLVGWPQQLDLDLLARVLEGGVDKAREAGVSIVGGHTVDDAEPKYGMAVTGTAHPDEIVRSSTARAGMVLVLTKPLSMGVISTAIKRGRADEKLVAEATRVMATLNAGACEAMRRVGAGAVTDVTGFGLIGHLQQMVRSSGMAAEVWSEAVPVLEGVRPLVEEGLVPGGTRRNEAHFSQFVTVDEGVGDVERTILFDAQTSGGLLIAVEEDRTGELIAALDDEGTPAAAVVGRVTEGEQGQPGHITVRRTA